MKPGLSGLSKLQSAVSQVKQARTDGFYGLGFLVCGLGLDRTTWRVRGALLK